LKKQEANVLKRYLTPIFPLLLSILLSACSSAAQEAPTPTPIPKPVVPTQPTYEVQRGDVTTQFQFVGRIRPVIEEQLTFRIDGRVRNVYVKQGEPVAAGQVLADLETLDDLENQQVLDDLNIQRAQINLDTAKLNQQLAETAEDSPTKDIEVAIRENQVKLAQIALDEVMLGVSNREAIIESAKIIAPFDGQVMTVGVSPGTVVNAFASGIVIADIDTLEVVATLRRAEVEELTENMPAVISPVNRPGDTLNGSIRRLPYQGTTTDEAAATDETVRVVLETPPSEASLELNNRVNVTIPLQNQLDVLWLPPQAIRTFEGRKFVVVREGDVEQRVDVKLGLQNQDRVEIVEGLTEGQIVVGT
jgi:membrane fusion protein, macrolide-specific efflux system